MRPMVVALIAVAVFAACEAAPAPTDTPLPPPTPAARPDPWGEVWTFEENDKFRWLESDAHAFQRAGGAVLQLNCTKDVRATDVRIGFNFMDDSTPTPTQTPAATPTPVRRAAAATAYASRATRVAIAGAPGATATAEAEAFKATLSALATTTAREATAEARVEATTEARAEAAEDSIDQIHISRRNAGEAGRWMKSGWNHGVNSQGYLVLRQSPAAAFIGQLGEVEEFAVLVTHDWDEDTAAVFDVRYLNAALASDTVGWDC